MKTATRNTKTVVPFHVTLEHLEKSQNGQYCMITSQKPTEYLCATSPDLNHIAETGIFSYTQNLDSAFTSSSVIKLFKGALKNYHPTFNSEIFIVNENLNKYVPADSSCSLEISDFIREKVDNGIIDWIAESKKLNFLPFSTDGNSSLSCFIIPAFNNKSLAGFLVTITPLSYINEDSTEFRLLKFLFEITFSKLQQEKLRIELNKNYAELQTLQSKIANDYKLAAIGEFTSKAIENIASPLQVILSCTDLLPNDINDSDNRIIGTLKEQINEIKEVIKRLTYFIASPQTNANIQSCNINDNIKDFYKLIEQSLQMESYECVLDLDEKIPPILSNQDNLKQILINSFSLINPFSNPGEGIVIQSRYSNQFVVLRFLLTNKVNKCEKNDVGMNILRNLMDKHEGFFDYSYNEGRGTALTLSFPLKRKNRS